MFLQVMYLVVSSQLARTLQFTYDLENYGRFLIRHSTIARKAYAVSVHRGPDVDVTASDF